MTVSAGFHDRLRAALSHAGVEHRRFARLMERTRLRGSSYRTLVSYLAGHTTPRTDAWVGKAAELLHVHSEWLAHGEGEMVPGGMDLDGPRRERLDAIRRSFDAAIADAGVQPGTIQPSVFWSFVPLVERYLHAVLSEPDGEVMVPTKWTPQPPDPYDDVSRQDIEACVRFLVHRATDCFGGMELRAGDEFAGRPQDTRFALMLLFESMRLMVPIGVDAPSMQKVRRAVAAEDESRKQRLRSRARRLRESAPAWARAEDL